MTTLTSLKSALKHEYDATVTGLSPRQPLTDAQGSTGFEILMRGSGWTTHKDFIIPHLSHLLTPFMKSRTKISVLEIGPGPKSVLGQLPVALRQKIGMYTAFESNDLFATRLEEWLAATPEMESPLPGLAWEAEIHRVPFNLGSDAQSLVGKGKFHVILFSHGLHGMNSEAKFDVRALYLLVNPPEYGVVVLFHRDGWPRLDGLVCHRTASSLTEAVRVADYDEELDRFTPFVAGFTLKDTAQNEALRAAWRTVCRTLGQHDEAHPKQLIFSSSSTITALTKSATALPELTAQVPLRMEKTVPNREAMSHHPAAIVRPTQIQHIQQCVRWALKHQVGLTVLGGGHSGHCRWPKIVAVDMSAFNKIQLLAPGDSDRPRSNSSPLAIVGAGCTTRGVVSATMQRGLTVPLGSHPSLGAGAWLQGGIGHLARLYGLSSDAIVGAVMVSVENGQVLCIGRVPSQYQPVGAVTPENEADHLWAIRGAGTNFGIVVGVVFETFPAVMYSVRNWVIRLDEGDQATNWLYKFQMFLAFEKSERCSVDTHVWWEEDQLHLGVNLFEIASPGPATQTSFLESLRNTLGPEQISITVNGGTLFETEKNIFEVNGGHDESKTSSFRRCLLLRVTGQEWLIENLVKAMETCPTPLCYLHLMQGGGKVRHVEPKATAFGCRYWDFACVITGVWPREQDRTALARRVVDWVYKVAEKFLVFEVYPADLGPDPRDARLAAKAFGPNRGRLARLKRRSDPHNVLAYAFQLSRQKNLPKLIVLVTGESGAGKDHCAKAWTSKLKSSTQKKLRIRTVSIGDVTRREYAEAHPDVDMTRLLLDRAYKEEPRSALKAFFQDQLERRPRLREEHFLRAVFDNMDADAMFITGVREEAPVAVYSHLVPESRLIEIRVEASEQIRQSRQGRYAVDDCDDKELPTSNCCPSLIFNNDNDNTGRGMEHPRDVVEEYLEFLLVEEDLEQLAKEVRCVPDFPRPGLIFQHVLGLAQLRTSALGGLMETHPIIHTDLSQIGTVVCYECGGFLFGPKVASLYQKPLVLICDAGKLPPPTISVPKSASKISFSTSSSSEEKRIEMERDLIRPGSSVAIIHDVLATGKTLCAMINLLELAGISPKDVTIIVVAEFPVHRGRQMLREKGFGAVNVGSLLIYGSA